MARKLAERSERSVANATPPKTAPMIALNPPPAPAASAHIGVMPPRAAQSELVNNWIADTTYGARISSAPPTTGTRFTRQSFLISVIILLMPALLPIGRERSL